MERFYKSILEQDRSSVVICNLNHEIIYMNPAAVQNYENRGGDKLIGKSLLDCHNPESVEKIRQVVDWFAADESHNIVYTFYNEKQNKDVYMVWGGRWAPLPAAPARCSCRRAAGPWSSGAATPRTRGRRRQACPPTHCRLSVACGSAHKVMAWPPVQGDQRGGQGPRESFLSPVCPRPRTSSVLLAFI